MGISNVFNHIFSKQRDMKFFLFSKEAAYGATKTNGVCSDRCCGCCSGTRREYLHCRSLYENMMWPLQRCLRCPATCICPMPRWRSPLGTAHWRKPHPPRHTIRHTSVSRPSGRIYSKWRSILPQEKQGSVYADSVFCIIFSISGVAPNGNASKRSRQGNGMTLRCSERS